MHQTLNFAVSCWRVLIWKLLFQWKRLVYESMGLSFAITFGSRCSFIYLLFILLLHYINFHIFKSCMQLFMCLNLRSIYQIRAAVLSMKSTKAGKLLEVLLAAWESRFGFFFGAFFWKVSCLCWDVLNFLLFVDCLIAIVKWPNVILGVMFSRWHFTQPSLTCCNLCLE